MNGRISVEIRRWASALVFVCLAGVGAVFPDERALLHSGEAATHSLSTGEIHHYRLDALVGHSIRIEIGPEGIDVGWTLRRPDTSVLAQAAFRNGEPRLLRIIVPESGPYELEVRALETDLREGHYILQVKEDRPAGPDDMARVDAGQDFADAERLWAESESGEGVQRALRLYQAAFDKWGVGRDPPGQIIAARQLGLARYAMGSLEDAALAFRLSLALSEQTGDVPAECAALSRLALAEVELDLAAEAGLHTDRALSIARRTNDRRCEADTLNVTGDLRTLTGRNTEAPGLYEQALSISRQLQDRRREAQAHLNLGYTHADMSRIDQARASYEAAIGLWRSVGERRGLARALIGLAQLHGIVGERQRALSYYQQARGLVDALGDRWGQAVVQSGLGATNFRLGEVEAAVLHYRSAVELFRNAKIAQGEAANLMYLAACLAALGRSEEALKEELRALEIAKSASNARLEARVLHEIGQLHYAAGRFDEGLTAYRRALPLAQSVGDVRAETNALSGMAEVLVRQGHPDDARARFEEALRLADLGKDRFATSNALFGLARLEAAQGRPEAALSKAAASLALVEELRTAVASLDLRASYVASIRDRHELEIDLLTELHQRDSTRGYDARAFESSERARARSLLDGLAEARGGIHEGVDPVLLARDTSIGEQLNARAGRLIRMSREDRASPEGLALEKEIDALTASQKDIRAQIRAESPRYAALVEPRPLSLSEIQKTVVDEHSVLLQYFLGSKRSYVWAVTSHEVAGYVLPARGEIEALVSSYREILATPGVRPAEPTAKSPAGPPADPGLAVSQVLLGPVAAHLDASRVVVVADGALESLPFAVLPDPRHLPTDSSAGVPLVKEHEVVSLPSASTLSLIRGAWQGGRQWPKEILLLADPVFEADDPRLVRTGPREAAPSASVSLLRDADGRGLQSLPRLLGSRQEALRISALSPGADVALGFEASREKALEAGAREHRIVHFATHAIVDNHRPELSGIVLSLFDNRGLARDGFLRLHDVYNMTLPVDLVVLSGCSSALGKPVVGEGLISLVRGFMYAGTRRVLASLWKVDDEATSELMTRFYRGMWKEGLTPSASLRAAQLDLMAQKRWRHPFYWAAFVLSGDWAPN